MERATWATLCPQRVERAHSMHRSCCFRRFHSPCLSCCCCRLFLSFAASLLFLLLLVLLLSLLLHGAGHLGDPMPPAGRTRPLHASLLLLSSLPFPLSLVVLLLSSLLVVWCRCCFCYCWCCCCLCCCMERSHTRRGLTQETVPWDNLTEEPLCHHRDLCFCGWCHNPLCFVALCASKAALFFIRPKAALATFK